MKDPHHALDHYRDALYYDHTYARYKQDVLHYVRLAEASGGPVLELGGGTGRIAFATAEAGIDVVLVDRMAPMLDRARERLAKLPRRVRERVEIAPGDLRDLRLDRRFPLVTAPFNVLQHVYSREDIEAAFATVKHHLAPGGRFAFDVLLPDPPSLSRNPTRFYKCRPVTHPKNRERYGYAEAFEYDHEAQIQTTSMRFESIEGDDVFYVHLTQRQFFPRELEALLHYNGFTVLSHAGGFDGQPIDNVADSQVLVARAT